MRKVTTFLLSFLLLFSIVPSSVLAAGEPIAAVALSGPSAPLTQGESAALTATVTDSTGSPYADPVTWTYTSTNDYVATVDQAGSITANNPGTATMIVSATAGGVTVSDTCTVQVVSGYTGYTFEDVEIGTLPAGFTSDSGASVQQEAADNRALYVPSGASVEYALSGSRLTVNFDAWTETETASLKVELLNGADVAATYQEDCATAARALHLEVDTAGQTLLFSMDGAYTLPIALSSAVDTLRITVTGDDGWIDNFDCSTGIAPAVLDFEDGTVGAEPTGLTNIIQATVTDANAFESKQSVVVNDTSASQAGSARLVGTKSTKQTIDFDLYIESVSSSGGVSMKILNGGNANANTAFWVRFKNGSIYAYTGSWGAIGTGVPNQKWMNVHIEADVTGEALVYIDGKLVATCPRTDSTGGTGYGGNAKTQLDSYLFFTGGNASTGDVYYVDNLSMRPAICTLDTVPSLVETDVSDRVNIALNTEPVLKDDGTPYDVDYIKEDYADGFGWAQIPFLFVDSDYETAYINYSRHRDVTMDDPIDSVKMYDTQTITDAIAAGETDLTQAYDAMKTDYDLFLMSMTEIEVGPYTGCYFAQNYIPYFTATNTASTVSWIVDPSDGSWTKVEGTLTLDSSQFNVTAPTSGVNWFSIVFSKGIEILSDGTILQTMYGDGKAILVESTDWGKTWTLRSIIAENTRGDINTDNSAVTFYEPSLQRCADGTLLSVIRTGSNLPLYQARSYDDGLTWTDYELLPGIGTTVVGSIYPQSVLLDNGILVLTTGRPNNSILLSLDGSGYNWGYATTTMTPPSGASTTGNTSIAKIAGNTVLIVGDRGFVQDQEAGIWALTVDITRNSTAAPVIDTAYFKASEALIPLNSTMQTSLGSIIDSNGNAIAAEDCEISYYSLKPEVASISASGTVTANSVGTVNLVAAIAYQGVTINTNTITIEVADPDAILDCTAEVEDWVLAPGESTQVHVSALNAFGAELDAQVSYTSQDSDVFTVSESGVLTAVAEGVAAVDVLVSYKQQTLTRSINVIVESDTWYIDTYDELEPGDTLPDTHTRVSSTAGVITTDRSYSGSNSLYVKDDITSTGIQLTSSFPASTKGVIVEFMMNIERLEHLASIGIGSGKTNTNNESAWFAFATPNMSGGPIRMHSYNGSNWINVSADVGAYMNEWFKVRIEATVDKPARLYVNDRLVCELFEVKDLSSIDRIRFTTGGTGTVDDWYYIDDLKVMTFNDASAPRLSGIYSGGQLIDGFDPDVFDYSIRLPLSSATKRITATAAQEGNTVTITGSRDSKVITVTSAHGINVYTLQIDYRPVTDGSGGQEQTDELILRADASTTRYIDGYPDGTFGIRGDVTRAELANMLYRLSDTSNAVVKDITFSDVPEDFWAADAIQMMASYDIFLWEGDTFKPNQPATRAEVARALVLLKGLDPLTTPSSFTDCAGHPLDGYIAAAQENGLVDGYTDGSFKPDATITRSEVVAVINRTIQMPGEAGASLFTDVAPDFWALEYINAATIRP